MTFSMYRMRIFIYLWFCFEQGFGSISFWRGSGSGSLDPHLGMVDPDPDPGIHLSGIVDPDPDPRIHPWKKWIRIRVPSGSGSGSRSGSGYLFFDHAAAKVLKRHFSDHKSIWILLKLFFSYIIFGAIRIHIYAFLSGSGSGSEKGIRGGSGSGSGSGAGI